MIATPKPVTMVAAYSHVMSGATPRNAEPAAVAMSPASMVVSALKRAISSDPSIAAQANSTGGRPVRMPTCVSDIAKSARIGGMTGGTARIVMRSPAPASQRSNIQSRI